MRKSTRIEKRETPGGSCICVDETPEKGTAESEGMRCRTHNGGDQRGEEKGNDVSRERSTTENARMRGGEVVRRSSSPWSAGQRRARGYAREINWRTTSNRAVSTVQAKLTVCLKNGHYVREIERKLARETLRRARQTKENSDSHDLVQSFSLLMSFSLSRCLPALSLARPSLYPISLNVFSNGYCFFVYMLWTGALLREWKKTRRTRTPFSAMRAAEGLAKLSTW